MIWSLAWCQMLVSNSSLELSGGDDNSAAIGAEPRWLSCMVTESRAHRSPEVGLLPWSWALLRHLQHGCCFLARKCCLREINIACWHELKELSVKREEKYWNYQHIFQAILNTQAFILLKSITCKWQMVNEKFFNETWVLLWGSLVLGLPRWCVGKETRLPVKEMQETCVRSLIWEDTLEKEMATCSSVIAWKIPWTEEPNRLQSMGSQRVKCDWACICSLVLMLSKMSHHSVPHFFLIKNKKGPCQKQGTGPL